MFIHQHVHPDVVVIGAGGIGSNLLYNMFRDRIFYSRNISKVTIYDGDRVETKNLVRQNFCPEDLGKNKAFALASHYNNALPIEAIASYFDPDKKEDSSEVDCFDLLSDNDIIVGCVDNVQTRVSILERLIDLKESGMTPPLYIDAGNETYHGNIFILGDTEALKDYHKVLLSKLEKDDAPYHASCADVQEKDEGFLQIYDINMMGSLYLNIILKAAMSNNIKETYSLIKGIQFGQYNSKPIQVKELLPHE